MPCEWVIRPGVDTEAPERSGASCHAAPVLLAELHLWPHRSLPPRGFVAVIAGTAAFLAVPVVAMLGTPVLWGLLPFAMLALGALWLALSRSYRDGDRLEILRLWSDRVTLHRSDPGRLQTWTADRYWVRVRLHPTGGPVPNYVTLKGGGRELEIGAFLGEDERLTLFADLTALLAKR